MKRSKFKKMPDRIFICGFMATGKSTVGSVLAKKLQLPFQDLDRFLERREGRSIRQIFESEGEEYFREKEKKYLRLLTESFRGVVALGGGALQTRETAETVMKKGVLIFLETPMQVIFERIRANTNRPMALDEHGRLKPDDTLLAGLTRLYAERKERYEMAQIHIKSSGKESIDELVNEIIEKLRVYDQTD